MRVRRVLAAGFLLAGAFVVAMVLGELALRIANIPGVTYHTFQYDELTGQRFYPNTTMIYRNARGEEVRRRVNRWGYLDRNHDDTKPAGVARIGFFGDSFTEARQVPLDSTFFVRVERSLNRRAAPARYECIAIGMMGYGTLQSYLECGRWMEMLGLDEVVYVFSENDPGNLVPSLNMSDAAPYPVLAGDSLVIDRSFAVRYANKRRWPHRAWQFLKSHSLLFSTLETRLHLLKSRGVRLHVNEAERQMGAPTAARAPISYSSPPSMLPDSLRTRCMQLTGRVLLDWKRDVEQVGRRFTILYIPRPSEVKKLPEARDSWEAWLLTFSHEHNISIIDPSSRFMHAEELGQEMFYDHLTSRGHAELAAQFLADPAR